MNAIATLDRTQAATEQSQEEITLRQALVRAWRNNPRQGAAAHAAYAMIRGKSMAKTFSPITNPTRLLNGHNPHSGRDDAIRVARQGASAAWEWCQHELLEHGAKLDTRGRIELRNHPILSKWLDEAAAELPQWK